MFRISYIFSGFALFSMFFGSGNLVYPLIVGQWGSNFILPASLGFFMTAVVVPALGVLMMILYKGSYEKFFNLMGRSWGQGFMLLILLAQTLGSGPRCVTVAHGGFSRLLPISLWMFSCIYMLIVAIFTMKRHKIIHILGRYLTPLLILSLLIIGGIGLTPETYALASENLKPHFSNFQAAFLFGFKEGYHTADLISALFFSSAFINLLSSQKNISFSWNILISSSLGMLFLSFVYILLIMVSHVHESFLRETLPQHLLPALVNHILGPSFGNIVVLIMALACLTTSIAIVTVFAQYLSEKLSWSHQKGTFVISCITAALASFGYEMILKVTTPLIEVIYPILMVMTVFALFKFLKGSS